MPRAALSGFCSEPDTEGYMKPRDHMGWALGNSWWAWKPRGHVKRFQPKCRWVIALRAACVYDVFRPVTHANEDKDHGDFQPKLSATRCVQAISQPVWLLIYSECGRRKGNWGNHFNTQQKKVRVQTAQKKTTITNEEVIGIWFDNHR